MKLSPELQLEMDRIMSIIRKRIDQIEPRGMSLVRSHAQKRRRERERAAR